MANEPAKDKSVAEMDAAELKAFIDRKDDKHREEMKSLRALLRCKELGIK